jgi:hypothetical protein
MAASVYVQPLGFLNTRLVERVYAEHFARICRRRFEELQQRADSIFVYFFQRYRHIRAPRFYERIFCGAAFSFKQLPERFSSEERKVFHIFECRRYIRFAAEIFNFQERYNLIERPFRVKLYLRVLVGDAERFYRRLAGVNVLSRITFSFAERLCPELGIPVGDVF